MEKTLAVILLFGALLIGTLSGAVLFPTESTVEVEKPVIQYQNVTVEKEVFIEKDFSDYLNIAVEKYLAEVSEDLDDYEEITRVEVSDDYKISFTEDTESIEFEIEYRIIDTLRNKRTNYDCSVEIISEEDEEDEFVISC